MSIEAWNDTGDCRECRRRKYCKNQCTKAKLREKAAAHSVVRSFQRAVRFRWRMDDKNAMLEELRVTEMSIIGECSDQKVTAVFGQCYKLATRSPFTIGAVVSVLCSECRERRQSISTVVKDMEKKLQELARHGEY